VDAVSINKKHVFLAFSQRVFSFFESHRILADIKKTKKYI